MRRCRQPRLKSTRALEKFRNEVKLRAWLENNYRDVVAMYEDWHALKGLDANGDIVTRRISICRHTELAQVRGLKMIVSMFLEFMDVVVPVAQSALNNATVLPGCWSPSSDDRSVGVPRHQGEHERRERKRQQRREQRAAPA